MIVAKRIKIEYACSNHGNNRARHTDEQFNELIMPITYNDLIA